MKKYLIMYQLNVLGQKYEKILNYIKKYKYIKVMNSIYCIETNCSVESISNDIRKIIDENDWLLVMECHINRQGWLPGNVWNFFRK